MITRELVRKHAHYLMEATTNVKQHQATSKTGKVFSVKQHERKYDAAIAKLAPEYQKKVRKLINSGADDTKIKAHIKYYMGKTKGETYTSRNKRLAKGGGKFGPGSRPRKAKTEDEMIQARLKKGKSLRSILGDD